MAHEDNMKAKNNRRGQSEQVAATHAGEIQTGARRGGNRKQVQANKRQRHTQQNPTMNPAPPKQREKHRHQYHRYSSEESGFRRRGVLESYRLQLISKK